MYFPPASHTIFSLGLDCLSGLFWLEMMVTGVTLKYVHDASKFYFIPKKFPWYKNRLLFLVVSLAFNGWALGTPTNLKIVNLEMFLSKGKTGTIKWNIDWRKGHPETAPPRDPSHLQTPNSTTITDIKNACWEEPGMAITWEFLPAPDQYRYRYSQLTMWLSPGTPMEELGEGLKELKGIATL